jgi:hypothetical protein
MDNARTAQKSFIFLSIWKFYRTLFVLLGFLQYLSAKSESFDGDIRVYVFMSGTNLHLSQRKLQGKIIDNRTKFFL